MVANVTTGPDRTTRWLLRAGAAVGPCFVGWSLVLAATSPGFSLRRHELSLLLLGSRGWAQVLNFAVTGVLALAGAVGLRRALRPGRGATWGPTLLAGYGALLVVAAACHPDPQLGFPVGAPGGVPAHPSAAATVHSLAFSLLATAIVAAGPVLARRFAATGRRGWAAYCLATSCAVVVLVVVGGARLARGDGGLPLLGVAVAMSGWISAIHLRLLRGGADAAPAAVAVPLAPRPRRRPR